MSEDRGYEASGDQPWMVIYPSGDRTTLDITMVWDYEKDDYALASHKTFMREFDARDYAVSLAKAHNLKCRCDPNDGILDRDSGILDGDLE